MWQFRLVTVIPLIAFLVLCLIIFFPLFLHTITWQTCYQFIKGLKAGLFLHQNPTSRGKDDSQRLALRPRLEEDRCTLLHRSLLSRPPTQMNNGRRAERRAVSSIANGTSCLILACRHTPPDNICDMCAQGRGNKAISEFIWAQSVSDGPVTMFCAWWGKKKALWVNESEITTSGRQHK